MTSKLFHFIESACPAMTGDCVNPWRKGESGLKSSCTFSRFSLPSMQWHTQTLF